MSADKGMLTDTDEIKQKYRNARWSVFLAATLGYSCFYVCRLSLNVVKKPIVDSGVLTEGQLGVIGAALFIGYAIGKFVNGFLADRSNIRRFMSVGLLCSALINLALGFTDTFLFFVTLWAVNGWVQSMGAAPCVVGLSRWFSNKERGTYYGLWSSSHNIGEALTFIFTAWLVGLAGWQWGFKGAGLVGLLGFLLIIFCMKDTPGSIGLPSIASYKGEASSETRQKIDKEAIGKAQKETLRNPAIWMLALSSAFMYVSRYAVNSWGIFYLEANKGYTNLEASSVISISSIFGIIGTVTCGWMSDRFFHGSRNVPALIYGLTNCLSLTLFLFGPKGSFFIDATSMVLFGLSIGALLCYLGGLMATDIAPKLASGAALGVIGVSSYVGAAIQDLVSGLTIEKTKVMVNGVAHYDFSFVSWFWLGSAILSVIFALTVWNAKTAD